MEANFEPLQTTYKSLHICGGVNTAGMISCNYPESHHHIDDTITQNKQLSSSVI